MKLKDYIATVLKNLQRGISEVTFDIGLGGLDGDGDMTINDDSLSRVKFTVRVGVKSNPRDDYRDDDSTRITLKEY